MVTNVEGWIRDKSENYCW